MTPFFIGMLAGAGLLAALEVAALLWIRATGSWGPRW